MKQEMELAMKLLEKDIHEKQVSTLLHPAFLLPGYLQKISGAESRHKCTQNERLTHKQTKDI